MSNIISEDFFNLIKSKYKIYYNKTSLKDEMNIDEFYHIPKNFEKDLIIGSSVITGGWTGGNCWNDTEPYQFSTYEEIPNPTVFFKEIISLFDNKIDENSISALFEDETYLECEYYGNYSNHSFIYINLLKLYSLYTSTLS